LADGAEYEGDGVFAVVECGVDRVAVIAEVGGEDTGAS